jgi:hypothetical protein
MDDPLRYVSCLDRNNVLMWMQYYWYRVLANPSCHSDIAFLARSYHDTIQL